MNHTFFQKVFMTVLAGCVAAGLVCFYRNVVERARYENAEGWREIFKATPKPK